MIIISLWFCFSHYLLIVLFFKTDPKTFQSLPTSSNLRFASSASSAAAAALVSPTSWTSSSTRSSRPYYQRKFFNANDVTDCRNRDWCQFAPGFANSIRMTEFGPAMNIHLKTACLISKTLNRVDELVSSFCRQSPDRLRDHDLRNLNKFCRHMKIFTNHCGKRTFLIERFVNVTPYDQKIDQKKGTIASYFKETYP